MSERKRPSCFMEFAREYIREHPGCTAEEVAEKALAEYPWFSRSKDPIHSLSTTLDKQVRDGMEGSIVRRKSSVDGRYRYYPAGQEVAGEVVDRDPGPSTVPQGASPPETGRSAWQGDDGKEVPMIILRIGFMTFEAPLSLDNLRKAAALIESCIEDHRKDLGRR